MSFVIYYIWILKSPARKDPKSGLAHKSKSRGGCSIVPESGSAGVKWGLILEYGIVILFLKEGRMYCGGWIFTIQWPYMVNGKTLKTSSPTSTKFVQMMTVSLPLTFLQQCQSFVPIHLYRYNLEASCSQNVLKTNDWNLPCMN